MKKLNIILVIAILLAAIVLASPVSAAKPMKDVVLQYKFIGEPYKYTKSNDMVRDIGFKWNNKNAYPVQLTIVVIENRPRFSTEVLRYTSVVNPGKSTGWFTQKVLYHKGSTYTVTPVTSGLP